MKRQNKQRPAIVFDFGGVLIDWDPRYLYRKLFTNDERAMEHFLETIDFYEWNLQQDAGRPDGGQRRDGDLHHPGGEHR